MAHFLFVNPSSHRARGATSIALTIPPNGILILAAVVEASGHSVQVIDANLEQINPEEISAHVKSEPFLVGMTVNVMTIRMAVEYAVCLKQVFPKSLIAFGGPHASAMGSKLLDKYPVLDAVMAGEGEDTIAEIARTAVHGRSLAGIKGVIFRQDGLIVDNGSRPLITDIDRIPRPAYHLIPPLSRYKSRSRAFPVGYIFTSRGCPAKCTFCYRNFGSQWRPRSPENVIAEIAYLREKHGIRQLDIMDDNFTFDGSRAARILEMIIERKWDLKINLQIGVRVNTLTPELLKLMKRAGVFKFGFGIESGDKGILKKIKKGLELDRAYALVRFSRQMGFITHGYFIIGFPGDTERSMRATIDFAKELNPHYASFSICMPFPGTEIYQDIARNGEFLVDLEDGIDEGMFSLKGFFKYGDVNPDLAAKYCEDAWREFYSRPAKFFDVLSTVGTWGELQWLFRTVQDIHRARKH